MLRAPIPQDDKERLSTLRSYQILDTSEEEHFDEVTRAAALICDCEIALISLIDENRQWFKSRKGIDVCETPRDVSFCGHAIVNDEVFVIENAEDDKRFCNNPLVVDEPSIRFYAGAPLIAANGHRLGTLCVIDKNPKKLSEEKKLLLKTLAKQVMNYLEISKLNREKHHRINEVEFYKKGLDGHAIIAKTDISGKIISVNDMFCEISKYSREELIGQDHRILNSGYHSSDFFKNMWKTIKSGKPWRGEIRNRAKDGTFYWVDTSIFPHRDSRGIIDEYMAFRYDITDKKETELLNREIQTINKVGGWEVELRTMTPVWTDETYKIHDIEVGAEIKLDEAFSFYAVHERERIQNLIDRCIHFAEPFEGDFEFISLKGVKKWVRSKGVPEVNSEGGVVRIVGIFQDITEAKNTQEKKLKEINDILSSAPSCLKIINRYGQLIDMNPQGLRLIGASSLEEVLHANIYSLVEESHRQSYIEFNQRICAGAKESFVFEMLTLSGEKKWMESYSAPYKLSNGDYGHIAITNDITARIEREEDYKTQKALAHHNNKLSSIGELAAGVGHEINNPLAIAKGYVELLSRLIIKDEEIDKHKVQSYLSNIDIAINRIAKIVQALRTFSRVDNIVNYTDFSPITAIEESFNLIHEIYRREGIKLSIIQEVKDNDVMVRGNLGEFQQVIMNLISNAKDAISNNTHKTIEISCFYKENKMKISVRDNGFGISSEFRDKIFNPFFTTKDASKGTGIGLSLVDNIVKEMGGKITVESKLGLGATFSFELPAKKINRVNTSSSSDPFTPSLYPLKANVLIVDDEEGIRELLFDILEGTELELTLIENGKLAYQSIRENPTKYDLVISDIQMPEMDGMELLKLIRNNEKIQQPKFIFTSGGKIINFEESNDDLNKMFDGYILKPFVEEEVMDALVQCLSTTEKNSA